MIDNTEVIMQDQLIPSADPAKVRVHYPRGSTTVLSINNSGSIVQPLDPDTADGAWQRATVMANGNLLFLSDTPDSVGTLVLGAGLRPL